MITIHLLKTQSSQSLNIYINHFIFFGVLCPLLLLLSSLRLFLPLLFHRLIKSASSQTFFKRVYRLVASKSSVKGAAILKNFVFKLIFCFIFQWRRISPSSVHRLSLYVTYSLITFHRQIMYYISTFISNIVLLILPRLAQLLFQ